MLLYEIDEDPGCLHLPNAPVLEGGAAITLCGWVDVPYQEHQSVDDQVPTCSACLCIVAYCKGLRGVPRP